MGSRKVTFFVQLLPEWYEGTDRDGMLRLADVSAERLTKRQPREPIPGAVVVPIVLHVEEGVFSPLDPVYAQVKPGEGGARLEAAE